MFWTGSFNFKTTKFESNFMIQDSYVNFFVMGSIKYLCQVTENRLCLTKFRKCHDKKLYDTLSENLNGPNFIFLKNINLMSLIIFQFCK